MQRGGIDPLQCIASHPIFDQNADQRVKTLLIWEFINVGFNNVEVLEGINIDERVLGLLPTSNYVTSINTLQEFDRICKSCFQEAL